jgi:hypothetical protein
MRRNTLRFLLSKEISSNRKHIKHRIYDCYKNVCEEIGDGSFNRDLENAITSIFCSNSTSDDLKQLDKPLS